MYNSTTINVITLAIKNKYYWLDFDFTADSFVYNQISNKVIGQNLLLLAAQIRTIGEKKNMKGMSGPRKIGLCIYNLDTVV